MKVYFAGKVRKHGWREYFISRGCEPFDYDLTPEENLKAAKEFAFPVGSVGNKKIYYNGPYVISCDHGCYHADNAHGMTSTFYFDEELGEEIEYECMSYGLTQDDVFNLCTDLIDSSDAVFCYIDANDIYGTIFELGYAYSKNIPVFIYIENGIDVSDMWFSMKSAEECVYVNTIEEAWDTFVNALFPKMKSFQIKQRMKNRKKAEPLTEPQLKYLTRLTEDTLYHLELFSMRKYTRKFKVEVVESLNNLSKQDGRYLINDLKEFNENIVSLLNTTPNSMLVKEEVDDWKDKLTKKRLDSVFTDRHLSIIKHFTKALNLEEIINPDDIKDKNLLLLEKKKIAGSKKK